MPSLVFLAGPIAGRRYKLADGEYDVAMAMVWVEGDQALNTNEAVALSSCSNCVSVAVAFQVVVIVGDSVFVHGGVSPAHVRYGLGKANREVRAWLEGGSGPAPSVVTADDGLAAIEPPR